MKPCIVGFSQIQSVGTLSFSSGLVVHVVGLFSLSPLRNLNLWRTQLLLLRTLFSSFSELFDISGTFWRFVNFTSFFELFILVRYFVNDVFVASISSFDSQTTCGNFSRQNQGKLDPEKNIKWLKLCCFENDDHNIRSTKSFVWNTAFTTQLSEAAANEMQILVKKKFT